MATHTATMTTQVRAPRRVWPWLKAPVVTRTVLIGLAVLAWDLSTRLGLVDPLFVSTPGSVARAVGELAGVDAVQHAFRVTGQAIAVGFVVGTAIGLLAGLAIGLSRIVRDAFYGPVLFVLSTPKSIFIPVFLVIFGIERTATAFGTFEAFFYVTVNVVGGVDLVEQRHRVMARAYRANPWQAFLDVILPASLPGVFAGVWYGIKHAFLAVVIVELYLSAGGLGQVIRQYTNQLETDRVLALILTVSFLAIVVGVAWTRVERRLARWRADDRVTTTTVL